MSKSTENKPNNPTEPKTADGMGLASSDLFAHVYTDDVYMFKDRKGKSHQVLMMTDYGKKWGLFVIGASDPYDTDQNIHDLLKRRGIRLANAESDARRNTHPNQLDG